MKDLKLRDAGSDLIEENENDDGQEEGGVKYGVKSDHLLGMRVEKKGKEDIGEERDNRGNKDLGGPQYSRYFLFFILILISVAAFTYCFGFSILKKKKNLLNMNNNHKKEENVTQYLSKVVRGERYVELK